MSIWEQVGNLEGETLKTATRRNLFKIDVVREAYLVIIPRDHEPRLILRKDFEIAAKVKPPYGKDGLSCLRAAMPRHQHLSYILAIIRQIARA
jgi:hypothetical protein